MKVLVACEFSGIVREAFRKLDHDAISCDLLPSEQEGPHLQCDIRDVDMKGYDLLIAHPDCTYLANSGVHWLGRQEGRTEKMKQAAVFFKWFLEAPVPKICVENPVMHKYALEVIGRKHDQTIQPYQFGHDASKRTCLWLKGLPKLEGTKLISPCHGVGFKMYYANQTPSGQNKLGPSPDRWKERSRTYKGIAEAMAEQWGDLK